MYTSIILDVECAMSRNISPAPVAAAAADYEIRFIEKKMLQNKLHGLFEQIGE